LCLKSEATDYFETSVYLNTKFYRIIDSACCVLVGNKYRFLRAKFEAQL